MGSHSASGEQERITQTNMAQVESTRAVVQNSITDLRERWKRSREAAYRQTTSVSLTEDFFLTQLADLSIAQFEQLLNFVFLNSRTLGRGYQKAFGISWDRQDFVLHLSQLDSPCAQGIWQELPESSVLTRPSCPGGQLGGPRYCQFWREAFDGLVLGLSDNEHFVRHRSFAAGDLECIDLIYSGEEGEPSQNPNEIIWGAIAQEYLPELFEIQKKIEKMGSKIVFLGIKEKRLFYKFLPGAKGACGGSEAIFRYTLEQHIKSAFPQLTLQDASPVAVYGEKS